MMFFRTIFLFLLSSITVSCATMISEDQLKAYVISTGMLIDSEPPLFRVVHYRMNHTEQALATYNEKTSEIRLLYDTDTILKSLAELGLTPNPKSDYVALHKFFLTDDPSELGYSLNEAIAMSQDPDYMGDSVFSARLNSDKAKGLHWITGTPESPRFGLYNEETKEFVEVEDETR